MIVIGWLDFFLFIQVSLFLLIFFLQASRRYAPRVAMSPDMRQNEDWPDFVRDVKQGLEPGGGQHMCHWRGQSDCQITHLAAVVVVVSAVIGGR